MGIIYILHFFSNTRAKEEKGPFYLRRKEDVRDFMGFFFFYSGDIRESFLIKISFLHFFFQVDPNAPGLLNKF